MYTKTFWYKTYTLVTLILLICIQIRAYSQQIVTGHITDKKTHEALPNTSIYIKNMRWGTVSNTRGEFRFVLPQKISVTDSVCFSFIGYIPFCKPLTDTISKSWTIQLQSQSFAISEVIVHSNMAEMLLQSALDAIPQNYATIPVQMKGFYRETVSDNGAFTEFIEAVVDIYKQPYNIRKRDDIQILHGREIKTKVKSPIWKFIYFVDGPYEALLSDIAKNPNNFISIPQGSINFLNPRNFKYYKYEIEKPYANDNSYYTIHFSPKSKRAIYEGYIYIDKKDKAFLSLYYTIAANRLESAQLLRNETLAFLETEDILTLPVDYYALVSFEKWNDKYYLSYAKMGYQFLMMSSRHSIFSYISNHQQLFITETDTIYTTEIPWYNKVRRNQKLTTQFADTDSTFWNNYQIVEMEQWEKERLKDMNKTIPNKK